MTTHPQAEAVSSLLSKFQKNTFRILGVSDGEEFEKINAGSDLSERKQAVGIICSVDESQVYLLGDGGENCRLFIVLGNENHEIVADYSSTRHLFPVVDKIIDEFVSQWEK
jgi:hypothetical protein